MIRFLLAGALALFQLVAPAFAQFGFGPDDSHVTFDLYHRVEGDEVQVAIRVKLDRHWHLYHDELGGEGAVAAPTVITFESDSAEFFPAILPKPERAEQPDFGTWVWQHEGRFVIHGLGELDDPEDAEDFDFTVKIEGQICETDGVCIPVDETLTSKGAGPDAVWDDMPPYEAFVAKEKGEAWPPAEGEAQDGGGDADAASAIFDEAPEALEVEELDVTLHVREDGDTVEAVVVFDMDEHWHIGGDVLRDDGEEAWAAPTVLELRGEGVAWSAPVFPEPYRFQDAHGSPWFFAHEGRAVVYARGEKTGDVSGVEAWYTGQVCDDAVCLPIAGAVASSGAGSDADFAAGRARYDAVTSGGASDTDGGGADGAIAAGGSGGDAPDTGGKNEGLLQFLLLAVGGGLFALVMPCTYPMIPITISFFTKQADARGGSVLPLSLAYGAGIILIFVLIGVILGPLILVFATHWATNLIIGLAFLFFSLALFGAINLQPPAFLMSAAGKASMQGGYLGVFLMGATLVVTSFTCTAPFVGTLLAAAASGEESNLTRIALGMGIFGLTMAVPFFFLSLVPGRISAMPKGGEWMNTIKVTLGFVEVAAALKFISNADVVLEWGVLSRELFLLLWAVLAALAAAFLFGWIQIKGKRPEEVGASRSVFAIAFLLFGVYCWHGYTGHQMDNIMTALAPPYSSALPGHASSAVAGPQAPTRVIVEDDYDAAREQAIAQGKPLFLNFTGHTCVNCRQMELKTFPKPAVAAILNRMVEARLHDDSTDKERNDRIKALKQRFANTIGNPTYVLLDPESETVVAVRKGALMDEQEFADWLSQGLN